MLHRILTSLSIETACWFLLTVAVMSVYSWSRRHVPEEEGWSGTACAGNERCATKVSAPAPPRDRTGSSSTVTGGSNTFIGANASGADNVIIGYNAREVVAVKDEEEEK